MVENHANKLNSDQLFLNEMAYILAHLEWKNKNHATSN